MVEIHDAVSIIDSVRNVSPDRYVEKFFFPNYKAACIALESKISEDVTGVVLVDVDDTVTPTAEFMIECSNIILLKGKEGKKPHLEDLRQTKSGRFYEIPQYAETTKGLDKGFSTFFSSNLQRNEDLHRQLPPRLNALRFLKELESKKIVVGGYVSGRPEVLTELTAQWLSAYHFPEAPVFCMNADPKNPSNDKPKFIGSLLSSVIYPSNIRWYLLDDDIPTALVIEKDPQFSGRIRSIVPIIGRNSDQSRISLLEEAGILHGTYENGLKYEMVKVT